jgi:hypothetical protein
VTRIETGEVRLHTIIALEWCFLCFRVYQPIVQIYSVNQSHGSVLSREAGSAEQGAGLDTKLIIVDLHCAILGWAVGPRGFQRIVKVTKEQVLESMAAGKLPTFVCPYAAAVIVAVWSKEFGDKVKRCLCMLGRPKCTWRLHPQLVGRMNTRHMRRPRGLWIYLVVNSWLPTHA